MKMLALPALLLTGCGALVPNYYANTPTMEICRQYMTLPSLNVNHPARAAELERRGATCGDPASVAASQRAATAAAAAAISTAPTPAPVQQCQYTTSANGSGTMICR